MLTIDPRMIDTELRAAKREWFRLQDIYWKAQRELGDDHWDTRMAYANMLNAISVVSQLEAQPSAMRAEAV